MASKGQAMITEIGISKLSNGAITQNIADKLRISYVGCPHRGSTTCFDCPLAAHIARECDFRCDRCDAIDRCPCGQDRQETCTCGGYLKMLPLHFEGRLRWASQCAACGAIWSVGSWHLEADEFKGVG